MTKQYDILVVGGGHAGVEAAMAAARMGMDTALVTLPGPGLGSMPCNPSIGGIGKTHLVKEVDALGGVIARVADMAAIQYRVLNQSKGPAVRALRAQCDRALYPARMHDVVTSHNGLHLVYDEVVAIITQDGRVAGVRLREQGEVVVPRVIVTAGTFMQGKLHIGTRQILGGRIDMPRSEGLSGSLAASGLKVLRFKTGTPPRLLASSIDYARMEEQPNDPDAGHFSLFGPGSDLPKRSCHITYTNQAAHKVILDDWRSLPLFSGQIQGRGPRYCPSIEDKVVRFRHKDRHQVFIEPEGIDSPIVYPNGLATSIPEELQERMVHAIRGLEDAVITRWGYAVEYDYVDPTELGHDLQSRKVPGLYLAGQVIGTTGYEEAAALGLMAGINAALAAQGRAPFVLGRDQAYIGILVDDLVTRGVTEPYRMFTSRAEFRLHLRTDNAYERLSRAGYSVGSLDTQSFLQVQSRTRRINTVVTALENTRVKPDQETNENLKRHGQPALRNVTTMKELLKRRDFDPDLLFDVFGFDGLKRLCKEEAQTLLIRVRYEGYLLRQQREIERFRRLEAVRIPSGIDYFRIPGLSTEVREKLMSRRPATLGQASRMEGITPAAVAALFVFLKNPSKSTGQVQNNC